MLLAFVIFSLYFVAFVIYLLLFFVTSFKEGEKRAALLSLVAAIFSFLFFLGISSLNLPPVYWIFNLFISLLAIVVLFPFKKESKRVTNPNSRYDERDIMFARARYKAGSLAYEDYYNRRPDKKGGDDALRSMPQLLEPGGRYYSPIQAKIAETYFNLIEELVPLAEGKPAQQKQQVDSLDISNYLKQMAIDLGAVDSGIALLNPNHIYSFSGRGPGGYGAKVNLDHPYIFVFAVEMDYKTMSKAPKIDVVVESSKKYLESAKISISIASFIRSLGYQARAHMDMNYQVILPAAAVDAGLGEMGRLGILMHPKYGPRIRLGAVSTDLPLHVDKPQYFNGDAFCNQCKKCAANCPSGAISFGEAKENRGVKKWSTNQEVCYKFWREAGSDCGICMAVCPYSKPNSFVHNVVRFAVRNSPLAQKGILWADNLFYGKTPKKFNQSNSSISAT